MTLSLSKAVGAYRGLRRRARLAILLLAASAGYGAVAIGGGQYALAELEGEHQRTRAQLAAVEGETARLRDDVAFVTENIARYEDILARGMFAERNRLAARRSIETVVRGSGLEASIALRPETREAPDTPGLSTQYTVLTTPIEVQTGGILDADVFAFMRDMTTALPGFLVLHRARLERAPVVSDKDLEILASGQPLALVKGQFLYGWRSAARGSAGAGEGEAQ